MRTALTFALLPFAFAALGTREASAQLPPSRAHAYGGGLATPRGDIRTVGMAGATVGLADTFISSNDNPAGLSMSLGGIDTHVSGNSIRDDRVNGEPSTTDPDATATRAGSLGAAANLWPWGFGVGYLWQDTETSPDGPGTRGAKISVREVRINAARSLLDGRFALGVSAAFTQGERYSSLGSPGTVSTEESWTSGTTSVTVGALYRLPNRVILGVSFQPSREYAGDPSSASAIPGFNQPIRAPMRLSFGTGFIPNRLLRADFDVWVIGSTPDTTLLRDDRTVVGEATTVQPRLGVAYVFADFRQVQGTAFAGAYYEPSRIAGYGDRVHATGGAEAKFWVINFGAAFDSSAGYRNLLGSVGVDLIRVFERTNLIPRLPHPPYQGFFPSPFYLSERGLPRGLRDRERDADSATDVDPIRIGLDIPRRIGKKTGGVMEGLGDSLESLPRDLDDDLKR
jgi:hypothetical protein